MNIPSPQQARVRFFKDIYKASVIKAFIPFPFDNLNNGTRVLSDESECIRYIALYGGHHFYKLHAAYTSTNFEIIDGKNIEIIDWGCGQALATCVLVDYLIEKNISPNVSSITLIEPSQVALEQGRSFIRQMFQNNSLTDLVVRSINKFMDDLTVNELITDPDSIKVHLFSSIIDVESIDLVKLHQLIVTSFQGINRIICTSPYNPRKSRLDTFYNLFSQSHQPTSVSKSSEAICEEVFYAANGKYEKRTITRYERQFTVKLT